METTLQDDAEFLHRSPAQVQRNALKAAELGADRLRLTAGWSSLAPSPRARRQPPAPFDAKQSETYPDGAWKKLDTAVKAAQAAGLAIQIDLAFWAPRWAVRRPSPNPTRERLFPKAESFAEFATAAARRYNGNHSDPAAPEQKLPAVRMWTTWNEPNHPSFLQPQWARTGDGTYRPMSPHVYRAMHNAAYDALKRVSHDNQVLMGATASMGSDTPGKGGVPPLKFLRTLACLDDKLAPLRVPECANFHALRADGWSHHPYSRYTTPGTPAQNPDDAPIADTARLSALLEDLRRRGRIASRLQLFHTEYGYESKQDDPFHAPFTREQQAAFLGWSTFLAWKDPDTRMFAQFLLRDIDPKESGRSAKSRSYYRDWQSGLFDSEGKPKPAAQAFKMPFWAQTEGQDDHKAVLLFGEVRPARKPQIVRVEMLDKQTGAWAPIHTYGPSCDEDNFEFLTDHAGFFLRSAPAVGDSTYRFSWSHDDGTWESSVAIPVSAEPGGAPPVALR